jgi:mRNA-degrading endonuclease RelE of RelBE toxin-antitoxin system
MNEIKWQPKALKQLRTIKHEAAQKRIVIAVRDLRFFPDCQGVKKLINHRYDYRLKVGKYRVFFDFEGGTAKIVSIEEVKKRDEHTY